MKIRQGFVSNSSSSSFIFMEVKRPKRQELLDKIKLPHSDEANCDYGEIDDGYITVVHPDYKDGCWCKDGICKKKNPWDGCPHSIVIGGYLVGVNIGNIESSLKDRTMTQFKEDICKEIIKRYKLDIKPDDLTLEYGEYSEG